MGVNFVQHFLSGVTYTAMEAFTQCAIRALYALSHACFFLKRTHGVWQKGVIVDWRWLLRCGFSRHL